jgi:hypothetical protein
MLVAVLHGWATVTLGHHTSSAGLVQPKYGMASRVNLFPILPGATASAALTTTWVAGQSYLN